MNFRHPPFLQIYTIIENSPIHDYYFKPRPVFYGDGPRYFGVELEIDDGGECDSSAEVLMDIANQSKTLAYCKHDGSLDDGFEIVTHPMPLDCQLHEMLWAEVLDKAIGMGYLSHQAGTCGLHVHVSRKAFGDTPDAQDNIADGGPHLRCGDFYGERK